MKILPLLLILHYTLSNMYIYVLKLDENKYYIGKSNNISQRLLSHYRSNGSAWTTKYKPIDVIEKIDTDDDFDEDKYTLKYMKKYGIENVRGGSFTQIELNEHQIILIQQMIKSQNNECYKCGSTNHFINNCIFTQIESIVNKLQNKQEIVTKIETVSIIYERVLKLENIRSNIQYVLEFTITDFRTKKRYDVLSKELHEYRKEHRWKSNDGHTKLMNTIQEEIKDIENNLGIDTIQKMSKIYNVHNVCNSENIQHEGIIVRFMKLRRLAIKTNEEIEVIYKEYKNVDYLEEMVIALYEKLENM